MGWNPVRSKPVSTKTKREGRDQIDLAREGQNSFLSFGGAFRYRRRPLTHTLTWRKAGVWPHLREVSTWGGAHKDGRYKFSFLLCYLLAGSMGLLLNFHRASISSSLKCDQQHLLPGFSQDLKEWTPKTARCVAYMLKKVGSLL